MKRFLLLFAFAAGLAHATGSTINTTVPAANSALQSAPIRANFAAAASDINGLIGLNNGTSAPASPILGQMWLNTGVSPYVLNVWDGDSWDAMGTLNVSTSRWAVPIAQGGTGLTAAGSTGCVLTSTGSVFVCSQPTNTGTVTSVGLLLPSALFNVTGSPVTTSGTFAASLQPQTANSIWAGPTSGGSAAPTFRAIVPADIPTLNQNTTGTAGNVTGIVAPANGGTGLSTCSNTGYVLAWTGTAWACQPSTAGGTVTSVGLSLPLSIFSVSGSPVTGSGTLTGSLNTEPANFVWAGPASGSAAAPAFRSLVGLDLPVPGASSLGGAFSSTAGSNQFVTGLNTSGALTYAQPSFSNISGVATGAQLPTPTATTLGGVQSFANVSNQWISSISTAGVPTATQPAFTNLSGSLGCSQEPAYTGDVTKTAGSCATTVSTLGGKAVSLGGAFTTSGAFGLTETLTGTTSITLPTSGTVATTANINTALPSLTTSQLYKGTGAAGAAQAAVSGTDYAPATSGSAVLKGNGAGGFSNAVSGTDYAPATSGGSILYGNGAGGFSNATIGTGLSFSGGTLTNTATSSISTPSVTVTTSNTTYTSNATPAAISALSQTLVSSGTYQFEADLYVNGGSQGLAVEMNGTATATTFISQSTAISASGVNQAWTFGSGQNTALAAACSAGVGSTINFVRIIGTIVVNAGGTFTVYASQGASGPTSTIIFTGSTLTLIRIS